MTAATVPCEQCARPILGESAVYSNAGKLLCTTCLSATQYLEADARSAAARRKVQVAVGVTLALLVIVPGAMFALGQGRIVARTLLVLGFIGLFGGNSARRMFVRRNRNPDPTVARGTAYVMLGGLAALLAGALLEGRF